MCNPPAIPVVQPAGPSSVQLASQRKIHVFHLATRPSSPPGPPFSVIPTGIKNIKTRQKLANI